MCLFGFAGTVGGGVLAAIVLAPRMSLLRGLLVGAAIFLTFELVMLVMVWKFAGIDPGWESH
jgi:hypothetical protein